MKYNPTIYHRRSIRLKGYDYSQTGAYFITICTQNRKCLFGENINGKIMLNDAGKMVQIVWDEMPKYSAFIETDAFIVMPNHIHGIITIVGADPYINTGQPQEISDNTGQQWEISGNTGQQRLMPDNTGQQWLMPGNTGQPQAMPDNTGQPQGVAPTISLPDVVHRFKTVTTNQYIDGVKQSGWVPFLRKLWQRNYYEHIIRNENELNRIREYITNNPVNWKTDKHYTG